MAEGNVNYNKYKKNKFDSAPRNGGAEERYSELGKKSTPGRYIYMHACSIWTFEFTRGHGVHMSRCTSTYKSKFDSLTTVKSFYVYFFLRILIVQS